MNYSNADSIRKFHQKEISPRIQKTNSIQNIAARSPGSRFQKKQQITANTLSSRKNINQNQLKNERKQDQLYSYNNQKTDASSRHFQKITKQIHQYGPAKVTLNKNNNHNSMHNNMKYPQSNLKRKDAQRYNHQIKNKNPQSIPVTKQIELPNGDKYIGQLQQDRFNGNGEYLFTSNKILYKGQFINGHPNGNGQLLDLKNKHSVYEGMWQKGMKHGKGIYSFQNEQYYNGQWSFDKRHGNGYFNFTGGHYKGQWHNNQPQGIGILTFKNGTQFKGQFEKGIFIQGMIKYPNGDQFNGKVLNGQRHCINGSYLNSANKIRYEGGWQNDRKNGKGTLYYSNGDTLSGQFIDDRLNQTKQVIYKWKGGAQFYGWFNGGKPGKGNVKVSKNQNWQV